MFLSVLLFICFISFIWSWIIVSVYRFKGYEFFFIFLSFLINQCYLHVSLFLFLICLKCIFKVLTVQTFLQQIVFNSHLVKCRVTFWVSISIVATVCSEAFQCSWCRKVIYCSWFLPGHLTRSKAYQVKPCWSKNIRCFVEVYPMKLRLHGCIHTVVRMAKECAAKQECWWTRHLFHLGSEECLLGKFSASILGKRGGISPSLAVCVSTCSGRQSPTRRQR